MKGKSILTFSVAVAEEFVSDAYNILRGHWCDITVLNVHAPTENKGDDTKDNFYEEP
jgi:hypothetical protein